MSTPTPDRKRQIVEQYRADLVEAHERGFRDAIDVLRAVPTVWAPLAADVLDEALKAALAREVTDDAA